MTLTCHLSDVVLLLESVSCCSCSCVLLLESVSCCSWCVAVLVLVFYYWNRLVVVHGVLLFLFLCFIIGIG